MANVKRAVSPLIATILLIALTVSIGAMIIGWGRQYVQQQTGCLGASASIIKAQLNTTDDYVIVGFTNNGNQKLDPTKVYVILYTSSGKTFKCLYYDDDSNPTTQYTGNIPTKLPCILVNPVNETGGGVTSIDPGEYVEYSVLYSSSEIPDTELQFNAYVRIGYSNCNEISEQYPIS